MSPNPISVSALQFKHVFYNSHFPHKIVLYRIYKVSFDKERAPIPNAKIP